MQRPNLGWRRKALAVAHAIVSIAALAVLTWGGVIAAKAALTAVCRSLDCAPLATLEDELRGAAPFLVAIAAAAYAMHFLLWTRRRADDAA